MTETLLEQQDGAVVTLTLNRPARLNAIVPEMSAALLQALTRIGQAANQPWTVLCGGKHGGNKRHGIPPRDT